MSSDLKNFNFVHDYSLYKQKKMLMLVPTIRLWKKDLGNKLIDWEGNNYMNQVAIYLGKVETMYKLGSGRQ
jgi:hypothetical protein